MDSTTGRCYHLGLIGYPLDHSRSPQLHQAALRAAGLEGDYRLFAIPPNEAGLAEIGRLVEDLRAGRLHGLNVTIPHKQNVAQFIDRLSNVARAVGAVNTLYIDGEGRVTGENTDVPGFLRDVRRLTGAVSGRALVLGAGGAGRAVLYALARSGWQVNVLARRGDQAIDMANEIEEALIDEAGAQASGAQAGVGRIEIVAGKKSHAALEQAAQSCDLLVNATPLGMSPEVLGCPWPEDLPLPAQAAVYDLVYNPSETVLVRRARQAGLRAATGGGMLAAQAALAFQLWTGVDAPFEIMEQVMKE